MSKTEKKNLIYKSIVKSQCDLFAMLDPSATIYRTFIGRQFSQAGKLVKNSVTIPGFLLSEAMEEWAIENGRKFAFDMGPNGKATKVRIEP
jgi:hypothetical protein